MKREKTNWCCSFCNVALFFGIISMLLLFPVYNVLGQEAVSFSKSDSLTYSLYQQSNWKKLTIAGQDAIEQGFDYYFLRMRLGIAFFYKENYRTAAAHFEKALEFNDGDAIALDYLRNCYEWGGMEVEAAWLQKENSFPESKKVIHDASVFFGHAFSGNEDALAKLEIDGDADIYGEVLGTGNISYINAGLTFSPVNYLWWYSGYTNMQVSKHQRVITDGADTLDNKYTLSQHHIAARLPIRVARGWNLVPTFDLINFKGSPVVVSYDNEAFAYIFDTTESSSTDYIAGLKIFRELSRWSLGAAISRSDLNQDNQWQGSIIAGFYPKANLNLYAFSVLSLLNENDQTYFHSKITLGSKIMDQLWVQGSAHFGHLKNAHDESSLVVYNTVGNVVIRSTFTAILFLTEKLILQLDYSYIKNEDNYLEYEDFTTYRLNTYNYNNHHIMGGVKWKL